MAQRLFINQNMSTNYVLSLQVKFIIYRVTESLALHTQSHGDGCRIKYISAVCRGPYYLMPRSSCLFESNIWANIGQKNLIYHVRRYLHCMTWFVIVKRGFSFEIINIVNLPF